MTTNQKLRDELSIWRKAFNKVEAENDMLQQQLDAVSKEYNRCVVVALVAIFAMLFYVTVMGYV